MITLNVIERRLSEFAENHYFVQGYGFGSPDEVDLDKFQAFPLLYVVYTGADYPEGAKTYNLEVYLFDRPTEQEAKSTNRREVVSDSEQCLEDLIADITNGFNVFQFDEAYQVDAANVTPIIDERTNTLSGALLDLSISVPYDRSACNLPLDGVSPEGGEITYARRGLLRMLTQDGTTDVTSVNTIRVTNGTLTDEGNGVVSLSITGGSGGAVSTVNNVAPVDGNVSLDTDDIPEGATNLYYTEGRVDARVTALGLATESYVDTAVGVEEAARITADTGLQSQIDTVAGGVSTNASNITANATAITSEATTRAAADTALQADIDTNTAAISAEATARANADNNLQTQISSNDGDITTLDTRVTTAEGEIDTLQAADYVNTLNGVDGAVTIAAGSNVTVSTAGQTITISSSGGGGGGSDSFNTIAVPGQSDIVADHGNDTLNITAGNGINLTTNATTDTLDIAVDASTTEIPEGSNLYHTTARVEAVIAAASVTDLTDVTSAGSGAIITSAERTKLTGIEAGAEVNPTAAEVKTLYESNADTNAFTDAEQTKLAGIAAGAEVNVNADWNAVSGDALILNRPTIPPQFFVVKVTTSTAFTLDRSDAGRYIRFTASTAVTVTVPSGEFQTGDEILIEQAGTGQVNVSAGSGVTLNNSSANTTRTAERYAVVALKCVATDEFTLTGERELV